MPGRGIGSDGELLADSLPAEEWQYWQTHLESIELRLDMMLCEPGSQLSHLYFPTTATVSLTQLMDNGTASEFAMVGNDSALSVALFLGNKTMAAKPSCRPRAMAFEIRPAWCWTDLPAAPTSSTWCFGACRGH